MPFTLTHKVDLFDIDMKFNMRIDALARAFQNLATAHSTSVGVGPDVLFSRGVIWFLRRLEINITRYPTLGEDVTLVTWSRGFQNYTGLREFTVTSHNRAIVRGSSSWVFYDIKRKRLSRIPDEYQSIYQPEHRTQFEEDIEEWKTPGRIQADEQTVIGLRYSDFDANGHVNNTKYLDFIDTMLFHTTSLSQQRIKTLKIRFSREIGNSSASVQAGWNETNGSYNFNIYDKQHLYADGRFELQDLT